MWRTGLPFAFMRVVMGRQFPLAQVLLLVHYRDDYVHANPWNLVARYDYDPFGDVVG
ncbi:hypothetical protein KDAU_65640 [Dictyobacter aurantiacus]|uniref:Uncharacterized protein n=1 Tax=Dictyobacter aurantiacus TaxID=1936993 RepID=A0A401ZQT4_9CHLR|nr:hypothetical protein KDAU_65640 [Dictyobacter aurantiacus]